MYVEPPSTWSRNVAWFGRFRSVPIPHNYSSFAASSLRNGGEHARTNFSGSISAVCPSYLQPTSTSLGSCLSVPLRHSSSRYLRRRAEPTRLSKVKGAEEIKMDRAFVITQVFSLRAARTSAFHLLFLHWFKDSRRAWQSIPASIASLASSWMTRRMVKKDEAGCPDRVNRVNVRPVNGESN